MSPPLNLGTYEIYQTNIEYIQNALFGMDGFICYLLIKQGETQIAPRSVFVRNLLPFVLAIPLPHFLFSSPLFQARKARMSVTMFSVCFAIILPIYFPPVSNLKSNNVSDNNEKQFSFLLQGSLLFSVLFLIL